MKRRELNCDPYKNIEEHEIRIKEIKHNDGK